MKIEFLSLILSVILTYILVFLHSKSFGYLLHIDNSLGVQKVHTGSISHLGGLSVFTSYSIPYFLIGDQSNFLLMLWIFSLPVFVVGITEDFTAKITPKIRLLFIFLSIVLVFLYLDVGVNSIGIPWFDFMLSEYFIIRLLFTLIVIGGAINSLNIIDGFNGILGGYSILSSIAIAYISYILGDDLMLQLSLILTASTFGFLVFNFPFGKIFMGDGGAYFIGFMLAIIGLMLVDRHKELSNWFVLLIFMYPMYELLYSIYRRKLRLGTHATQPDAEHLHSLVYMKLISCDRFNHNKTICNSMVSPFMWLLSLVGVVPAVIWFDNQTMLIVWVFIYIVIYTILYKYVSSSKI